MFLVLLPPPPEPPAWIRGRSSSRKHRPATSLSLLRLAQPGGGSYFLSSPLYLKTRTDTFQNAAGAQLPSAPAGNARVSSSEPPSQTWLPRRVWKKQLTFPST